MKLTKNARKVVACALSAALVLGGTGINGKSASAAKKVTLKLNKKTAKITVGKKVTLKVKKKNVKSAKITWKSSKKSVAKVSKKGVVIGKKAGKAKISATIKYKAKGSKKTKKKTLKCTVTVVKKNTVASKSPTPTKKPSTNTPSTETPSTETPSTETPSTETPSTETPSTETPSTETPSTETPSTETPSPVQSFKISVMDGENVLDIAADAVTVKDANANIVTISKATDNTFTTDKLVAGTYTVSVAAVTIGNVSYNAIEKEVTIAADATDEVQAVAVDLSFKASDKSYSASAEIVETDGVKSLSVAESNDSRFKDVFSKGCIDIKDGEDTGNGVDWLVVDLSKIDTAGMYSPYITLTVAGGNINKVSKDESGNYTNSAYYTWKNGAFSLTSSDVANLDALGFALCDSATVKVDLVDKNALPSWNESAIPESVEFKDGTEYSIDLGIKLPIEGQKVDTDNVNVIIQCTSMDASYTGDWATIIEGTYEDGVIKITPDKAAIEEHIAGCQYGADLSKCMFQISIPFILSDGTTTYQGINKSLSISFTE